MKVLRRGNFRLVTLLSIAGIVLIYVYYHHTSSDSSASVRQGLSTGVDTRPSAGYVGDQRFGYHLRDHVDPPPVGGPELNLMTSGQKTPNDQCPALSAPVTDVNTVTQFPKFDFLVSTYYVAFFGKLFV